MTKRIEWDNWDQQLIALKDERKKVADDKEMNGVKKFLELERIDGEIEILQKRITNSGSASLSPGLSDFSLRSSRGKK